MKLKQLLVLMFSVSCFFSCQGSSLQKDNGKGISNRSVEETVFKASKLLAIKAYAFQSKTDLILVEEDSSKDESKEETLDTIPISFYVITLVIIIIAGYFMNKRKPLLNQ